MSEQNIEVFGAREHNLKNIDVIIPRNKLVVITGLSGSGKSSLAFDTIFAEGQRRYIETFSAYARQFLGNLERPDVDKIEGLSPVIAIEQKTTHKNPRSTVGTVTELYDFLRLLYARVATAYSYETGEEMVSYSTQQIADIIREEYNGKKLYLLAPLVSARKGHYRDLFDRLLKRGYSEVRVDGEIVEMEYGMKLDRYKTHDIELVVDKWKISADQDQSRMNTSLETAMNLGGQSVMIYDSEEKTIRYFSKLLVCPTTGISYPLPEPNSFSFNSPKGACTNCNGLGTIQELSIEKLVPDSNLSLKNNAIAAFQYLKHKKWLYQQLELILRKHNHTLLTPYRELSEACITDIFDGLEEELHVDLNHAQISQKYKISFEGITTYFNRIMAENNDSQAYHLTTKYTIKKTCPVCEGQRLRKESTYFKIGEYNISQITDLSLLAFSKELQSIPETLSPKQLKIGGEIIKEISVRLQFLLEVGLGYLSLSRPTKSLSGGESQRIRLATQIGTELMNVLYILDEPSIGLHQRDNQKLIASLQKLKDKGNSVLVVEHDKDMMMSSDCILDMGPGAGKHGGEIVWQGGPDELLSSHTVTGEYLTGQRNIPIPSKRRKGNGKFLELEGCTGHNLKNVTISIPLGVLTLITGVSGSGKSSLINGTLYPILNTHFYRSLQEPLPYKKIKGLEYIDKIIDVDQSPIGRTPRSNPVTYTGVFSEIRNLFTQLPEAKIRGYKPGRFSFNVKGGRCETCEGAGLRTIEMNFLPDVYVHCETCQGKRFNRETLEIRYKGKTIADVLEMTVDEAVDFFQALPKIHRVVKTLQDVGLGYISLGQSSTTLSGGEAQRIKLASELSKKQTGKTLYILDEPSTGLHFDDIKVLMNVIHKLIDKGNSVVIIEHNMDIIKLADWIIDLGPEGGEEGGKIIVEGTPEDIVTHKNSYTAQFLKEELKT